MDVRLIAFDLDGTTLVRHQFISEANQRALREAARRGMVLVPASGRMKDFLPQEITSLPGVRYAITAMSTVLSAVNTGTIANAIWLPKNSK